MSDYQGIALYAPDSGVISVPENIPHFYKNNKLQVIAVGFDSNGRQPADPPDEFKAPGFVRASGTASLPEPRAAFRGDGTVEKSGFAGLTKDGKEGQFWVEAEPAKELSQAEKDAKAFHDALAEPASLVPAALKQTAEGAFIEEIVSAVKKYIAS